MITDDARHVVSQCDSRDHAKLAASYTGLASLFTNPADALAAIGAESTPARPQRWMAVKWFSLQLRMSGDAAAADRWSSQLIGSVASAYSADEVCARQFDYNAFRAIEHWDDDAA